MDPTTAATTPVAPRHPRRNPLINRNYARLWGGQLVSNLGDFVFDITLIVWIAAQLAKGQPWAPLAVSGVFLAATCAQFFNPSRQALIASVVDEAQQPQASSLGQVSYALATIVGPPLAAPLLFAFGVQWALLINAASFFASFLAISSIHVSREATHPAAHARSGLLREYGAGLRFFFTNRILVTILIALVITGLGGGALNALDVFFFTRNLHAPAQLYGFAGMAFAAGALIGAVLGGLFARRIGLTRLVWLSLLSLGLGMGAFSRMSSLGPALPLLFLLGVPQATLNIAVGPIFMRITPRHLLGRVSAVLNPIFTIAMLLSTALAGYLASVLLRGFSRSVAGVTFGPLDTIFGLAALLLILGGLYAMLNLRGVALPSNASPSAPATESPTVVAV
jgi:MFS family permease